MHQTKKGNQWYHRYAEGWAYEMKVHAGVNKDSGLIHSVLVAAANVNDLTPVAELLHGDDEVAYGDAGYQGIAKRPEIAGKTTEVRVAMRPGKRSALPATPEGRLQNVIETAKAHLNPLQALHASSTIESVPGQRAVNRRRLARGLVCLCA
jgi:IS5 family transposase